MRPGHSTQVEIGRAGQFGHALRQRLNRLRKLGRQIERRQIQQLIRRRGQTRRRRGFANLALFLGRVESQLHQFADRGRGRGGRAVCQCEVEIQRRFCHRRGRRHGCRRHCHGRTARALRHGNGQEFTGQAKRIGRTRHIDGLVAVVFAHGDGLGPVGQVGQRLGGELPQRAVQPRCIRQTVVVELFAGPAGFAELFQPDHARAALERVEGPPHVGEVGAVLGRFTQTRQRRVRVGDDLAGFFDEDVAHLHVVFQTSATRRRGCWRRHRGRSRHRRRARRRQRGHGIGQFAAHGLARIGAHCSAQRVLCAGQQPCQLGLFCRISQLRQRLQPVGNVFVGHARQRGQAGQFTQLFQQRHGRCLLRRKCQLGACLAVVKGGEGRHAVGLAHHGAQVARFGVEAEQVLGQRRLHCQHVDEKAQRAQVVGQAVEGACLHRAGGVDLGLRERVDVVAHVQRSSRGLFETQHRQHAAHRRQLRRHRNQQLPLRGVAEVLVDLLFDLGQRGAQFLHHAAHRLAVADTAIQLLHPHFKRLGLGALAHGIDARRQMQHARRKLGIVELAVFQRCIEVEDGRGHFHGQRGRRGLTGIDSGGHSRLQGLRQLLAMRQQALQRLTDQRELLGQRGHAVQFTASHRRPGVFGCRHPLARQGQHGRVEAAQARRFVVCRRLDIQLPGLADGCKARGLVAGHGGLGLAAEEQQVLRQPV